jgi:hypothetical protein
MSNVIEQLDTSELKDLADIEPIDFDADKLVDKTFAKLGLERPNASIAAGDNAPVPTKRRFRIIRRFVYAAAALVAVVAVGLTVVNMGGNQQSPTPQSPLDFTLQAYAASTGQAMETSSDGGFYFYHYPTLGGLSPDGLAEFGGPFVLPGSGNGIGHYMDTIFSVQDESASIDRIRIETSKGELYRYTTRTLAGDEDPELLKAVVVWRPEDGRFMDEYDLVYASVLFDKNRLEGIAYTVPPWSFGGGWNEDWDKEWQEYATADVTWEIVLIKRVGSNVVEFSLDKANGESAFDYKFGILLDDDYFSDDYSKYGGLGWQYKKVLLGGTLSTTVGYDDGRESKLVIEFKPMEMLLKFKTVAYDYDPDIVPPDAVRVLGLECVAVVHDLDSLSEEEIAELENKGYTRQEAVKAVVIESSRSDTT